MKGMSARLERIRGAGGGGGDQVTERRPVWVKLATWVSEVVARGRQRPSRGPWEETGFHSQCHAAFETKTMV